MPWTEKSRGAKAPGWERALVEASMLESARLKERTVPACGDSIVAAARLIVEALRAGGKVLLCGNGGSAADCQHMAAELVGRMSKDVVRGGLAAIALTTDTSFLTAQANDSGFDSVFQRQVQALARPGDVLIAISTSGNSRNVLLAADAARALSAHVIALTGASGALASLGTVAVAVPSADTQRIQEMHLVIEHVICELVERSLFGDGARTT